MSFVEIRGGITLLTLERFLNAFLMSLDRLPDPTVKVENNLLTLAVIPAGQTFDSYKHLARYTIQLP